MYNTLWFSGAIIAAGANRGALNVGGDYSWRLITWLQALFAGIIVIFCMFLPESPRWLYVNHKQEQARDMLTRYHGHGNPDSAWVTLQLHEYEEFLDFNGADKRWWDYRALFRSRASIYRVCCNLVVTVFGQWAGNAVLSYFLGAVLDSAGEPTGRRNLAWFGGDEHEMTAEDWHDPQRRTLGLYVADDQTDREHDDAFLIWLHSGSEPVPVTLPDGDWATTYTVVAHTGRRDELPESKIPAGSRLWIPGRTVVVLQVD